jgi:hypothetical protein
MKKLLIATILFAATANAECIYMEPKDCKIPAYDKLQGTTSFTTCAKNLDKVLMRNLFCEGLEFHLRIADLEKENKKLLSKIKKLSPAKEAKLKKPKLTKKQKAEKKAFEEAAEAEAAKNEA